MVRHRGQGPGLGQGSPECQGHPDEDRSEADRPDRRLRLARPVSTIHAIEGGVCSDKDANSDCHAKASNGEYALNNGGEAKYKAYVDAIAAQIASA